MPSKPSASPTSSEARPGGGPAWAVLGVNHIGLAPRDPAKARWFFADALGLPHLGDELVADQQTMTVMIASHGAAAAAAQARLEVVAPSSPGAGPIGKFLEKRGAGIHHVALTVTGLAALLARLKTLGVRLIDETPRDGAHRTRIAFVHPEATGGLLVELVEELG